MSEQGRVKEGVKGGVKGRVKGGVKGEMQGASLEKGFGAKGGGGEEVVIEVMDTTLRDGEQMMGVAYSISEKRAIGRMLLEELLVDRLEICSARVSEGEREAACGILEWAKGEGIVEKVEILGFVDYAKSVDWIMSVGGNTINLLMKGSRKHVEQQIKKSAEEHVADVKRTVSYAKDKGLFVNIYLEDWSSGMRNSRDYVHYVLDNLGDLEISRFMLPDTLGILYPTETKEMIKSLVTRYEGKHFDFHGHNDYGLGTANTLSAIEGGVKGVHLTVNGMGERAGNAPLDEVVVSIKDFRTNNLNVRTNINELALSKVSREVEIYSGQRLASNKPIIGDNVYTQTAGLHADGDLKGDLYVSSLLPERFGRRRKYALGKLSGKASLENNLKELNISLSEEEKEKVLKKVVELGDKKELITADELPYIIGDVLDTKIERVFKINSAVVVTSTNLRPMATVSVEYKGKIMQETSSGDGGYDGFMRAIKTLAKAFDIKLPKLKDYAVVIPPGGNTDALVQTTITWEQDGKSFKTKGVDSDQMLSAIEATEKMINIVLS